MPPYPSRGVPRAPCAGFHSGGKGGVAKQKKEGLATKDSLMSLRVLLGGAPAGCALQPGESLMGYLSRSRKKQTDLVEWDGKPCPKCRRPMERRSHPQGWEPKPGQPFYFAAWGYCRPCRHVQHYEAMKRYVDEPAEVDDIGSNVLPAVVANPAVTIPPDRFIPERFRTMRWRPYFGRWE
jgi:hypothetical protein